MSSLSVVHVLAIAGGIAVLLGLLYVFQIARRAKDELHFRLKRLAAAAALYALSCVVLLERGYTVWETAAFSFLMGLTPAIFIKPPKRPRYVPAHVKRAVMARDRGKYPAGEPLEIDHTMPHSKYGDRSLENLRAVPRGYNRRKGARWPRLLELFGRVPRMDRESPGRAAGAGREADARPERTGRLLRFTVGVLLLGLCWYGLRNRESLERNGPAVNSESGTPAVQHLAADGAQHPSSAAGEEAAPPQAATDAEPASAAAPSGGPTVMARGSAAETGSAVQGSSVQVVGIVTHVGKDELSLKRASDRHTVKCKFDSQDALTAVRPSLGVTVTARGRFKGTGWTGNVHIDHCELVTPKESTTQED